MKRLSLLIALMTLPLLASAAKKDSNILFDEGDWSAYKGEKSISLITSAGGLGFLSVCTDTTNGCVWAILTQPDFCVVGSKLPVLVYGQAGGHSAELTCRSNDDSGSLLVFNNFQTISSIVGTSNSVQVAVPVVDRIDVVEFNTKGYQLAAVKLQRVLTSSK